MAQVLDRPADVDRRDGIEREIKFSLDGRTVARLRRDPLLLGVAAETIAQTTEYWDTASHALRRSGWSLRLRRIDGRIVQAVKGPAGPGDGVLARFEREAAIDANAPDAEALRGCAPDALVDAVRGRLRPQFSVAVERTRWVIAARGAVLNVDLDIGRIAGHRRSRAIRELELELVSGPPRALFAVARQLIGRLPLQLAFTSKSEQGFALIAPGEAAAAPAFPGEIDPAMSRADAFRALAAACIRAFATAAAGFIRHPGPETIHRMRVAIRRFRTLLRLDRDLFRARERQAVTRAIASVFETLGAARNFDILLAEIADRAGGAVPADAIAALVAERDAARREVATRLRSPSFRVELLDLVAFTECGAWSRRPSAGEPARRAAAEALEREWTAVQHGRKPSRLSPARRHRLRIRSKRLRYAADFYAGLFPGRKAAKRRSALVASTTALQDALGTLNDRDTIAAALAARFPGQSWATALADDESRLLAEADAARRKLRGCRPFWS